MEDKNNLKATMKENELMSLFASLESLNKRQDKLELENKRIAEMLVEQNNHIRNIFKGYVALGIVEEDNGEMILEDAIKKKDFIMLMNQLVAENKTKVDTMLNSNDKFKLKSINEDYIVKKFELIDRRWFSILTYDKLWQNERSNAWNESMAIVNDFKGLMEADDEQFVNKANSYFIRLVELIAIQEKHMNNEEAHQKELLDLFDMRNQIIREVDETFLL